MTREIMQDIAATIDARDAIMASSNPEVLYLGPPTWYASAKPRHYLN